MHNVAIPILLAIPLLGCLTVFALPAAEEKLIKIVTLVTSLIALVYSVVLAVAFNTNGARFQFLGSWPWITALGTRLSFGMDGIAVVLVVMAALLVPAVVIASWNTVDSDDDSEESTASDRSVKGFFGLILLLEVFMLGVFAAMDVFLFYVFFEAMLVPMYFIIGMFGGPRRQYAAMKFFLYSLLGGLLMLAAVIGLYVVAGKSTFSFTALIGSVPDGASQKLLFLGFFIAFAIKAPLVPFHTWLPDAGAEAPFGGAALLVGVLDKVGTFGFLRYCLPLFPGASRFFSKPILVLCVIGVLYAAFLAMGQRDMKRLVAYTSIAHFGFIGLGVFAFTTQSGTGAVFYMFNHGLSTGALFLVVGFLIMRGKSRQITDYGGTSKVTPRLGGAFLLAGLSALALPGMSTFISEFLVLVGTFTRHKGFAIVATAGIVLAALYVLLLYQRAMQGAVSDKVRKFRDLSWRETLAVGPLLAVIIVLGIYPKPMLDIINPAVKATMSDVGKTDPAPAAHLANPGDGK
ncbi:MAG: NADH-quinone oxidoreductase subunit M [Jatrophihabitans sp.]